MKPIYGRASLLAAAAFAAMQTRDPGLVIIDDVHPAPVDTSKPPVRMDINTTPRHVCNAWRVFFNGAEQRACIIADREKGFILRYKLSIGSMPIRGRSGKYETEELRGKVEFRPKVESV